MTISKKIEDKVKKLPIGTTFTYQTLSVKSDEYAATAKTLERLIKKGVLKRVSTGVFYKPKQTVFGELKPREEELLKNYLFENDKRIAYITGVSLYNRLGLTTQIPKVIKIASRDKRIFASIGSLKGKPVKSYIDVSDKNYYVLEILDALKDFKQIPDMDKRSGLLLLANEIKKWDEKDKKLLLKYALKYPPRTRAILGAIVEVFMNNEEIKPLKESLNPLSQYEYKITEDILPNAKNWNIV
ncbi:DUF6088 family protein [Flavobacterium sp. UBA7682]|uniref:DUF6088 family protein n=1 Tax=Flavobacterium sp. UBA7682 TaxID=1946560 RepID=UPI0025C57538|nr:DUF6088 family protein [Flavobacterium sp. UBA7682]